MATVDSGANSSVKLTIDPTSQAARVTLYDSGGRELSVETKATYAAANTFTPAATPTDIVTIVGAPTGNTKILSFVITTTNTAAGSQQFFLIKRSAADTGGTSFPATAVPYDSNDAAAGAVVSHYTGNPSLGATVGNINIVRAVSPAAVPASFAGIAENAGQELLPMVDGLLKPVILHGNTQVLALNFNGAALVSGQTHAFRVVWSEEA